MHNPNEMKNMIYFTTIMIVMGGVAGSSFRKIGRVNAEASEPMASVEAAASYATTSTLPDSTGISMGSISRAPTGADGASDPLNLAEAKINRLLECQSNGKCPMEMAQAEASDDPKALYFAVSRAISNELDDLLPLSENPGNDGEALADLSRRMLTYDEDRVQLAALNLIYHLPTEPENLNAILAGLADSNDPELYTRAMIVFQRYATEEDQQRIVNYLADTMIHGSPAVSQAVALNISPLLDPVTTAIVEKSLDSLAPSSSRYVRLSKALQMSRTGR